MRRITTTLTASIVLLLTVLATPASATHATVYIYSPVSGKSWQFTTLDHAGYLGSTAAHDVAHSTWTSDEDVRFTAATSGAASLQAFVQTARTNCTSGGPDKWVRLNVYSDGTYRGDVAYVHLRTLNVTEGTWISTNTILGTIQNAASCCTNDGSTCWTGVHVHMEKLGGTWASAGLNVVMPYSTPVLTFFVGSPERPQQTLPLPGPVK